MEESHNTSSEDRLNSSRKRKGKNFMSTHRDYEKVASLDHDNDDSDIVMKVWELSFNSFYEAEQFYIAYGREFEFDIRRDSRKRISILWVCHQAGFKKQRDELSRQREARPETRCGCKAQLRVGYNRISDSYVVRKFEPEHNHPPATGEEAFILF